MILAMITEVVSAFSNHFNVIRVRLHPAACHKEGDINLMLIQNIHDLFRVFVSPCGIK